LVSRKNAIFRPKLAKIAENIDHNFDPCVSVEEAVALMDRVSEQVSIL
jgi:hypothetical protein